MGFKNFLNPKKVYDGYFETYFIRPFIHHFADFKSAESMNDALKSLAAWLVITLGVAGILLGFIGLLGPEVGFDIIYTGGIIWLALSAFAIIALLVRTTHHRAATQIKTKMLGIDTLFGVSSLLFFVFGLLMMDTTLHSGDLRPNDGVVYEEDTVKLEPEYIKEEPIFTYQDEAPAMETTDSMTDLVEPDLTDQEESYDPTITGETEAATLDTLPL